MDERFPKYLRAIVRRLDFLGLPNLALLIAGIAAMAFIAKFMWGTPVERFVFDPYKILAGEYWRLFAFPVSSGMDNPIWVLLYVMYVYFVVGALESAWGPGPLTVFVGFGYLCAAAAAFITMQPVSIWFYVLYNVSLAFGTLFPEFELYVFFILPVKAKWLSLFAGGLLFFQFILSSWSGKLFLLIVLLPYLIFFGPFLFSKIKQMRRGRNNRGKFDPDMWK